MLLLLLLLFGVVFVMTSSIDFTTISYTKQRRSTTQKGEKRKRMSLQKTKDKERSEEDTLLTKTKQNTTK